MDFRTRIRQSDYAFEGNANDSSGNGFHGTAIGGPAYVAGVEGQATQLDGIDDHVVIDGVGIAGAAPRTISGWAKADKLNMDDFTNVFGFAGEGGTSGAEFEISAVPTERGSYCLHRWGWTQNIIPMDLEWHHLAATFDGTTETRYGNGIAIGSTRVNDVDTTGHFCIGKRQTYTGPLPGTVDEVRVYDRALSAEETAGLAGIR
jgi:hypothetical protein